MKNLNTTLGIIAIALLTLTIMSCKDTKKEQNTANEHATEIHSDDHDHSTMTKTEADKKNTHETTAQKSDLTSQIIDGYIQLKNALVASDKKAAALAGNIILKAFADFDMSKLTETQHKTYMEIAENAKEQAEHIIKSPIDHQREHFEVLSTDINDLIALVGTNKTLYQDFCPMYNKNKGGMWLSETKDIKNPYFGDKMLTCGKVQKQIN